MKEESNSNTVTMEWKKKNLLKKKAAKSLSLIIVAQKVKDKMN